MTAGRTPGPEKSVMHRTHLEHYARDPLARELGRPLEGVRAARRTPTVFPERDVSTIASGGLLTREPLFRDKDVVPSNRALIDLLSESTQARKVAPLKVQDNRTYHPEGKSRPALKLNGVPADVKTSATYESKDPVVFANPGLVIPCIRRAIRREVMFAKRKGGRGYKVKHRRTWMSEVPC